ncbi:hypothetical protein CRYUN_Cryun15aG0102700 [Craigia yunnanensis]
MLLRLKVVGKRRRNYPSIRKQDPVSPGIYFHISPFHPNDNRILNQGDAKPSDGVIEFNNVNYRYRVGWATYANKVPLWNSKTGKLSDFNTRIGFTITMSNLSEYSHGFAFFLAPVGSHIPTNSAGALLGLFNTTNRVSALGQVVLVDFDTLKDRWDPDELDNHVGINNNSITSANYTSWNKAFTGGTLQILTYHIDLMKALPEWVMVGFSGSIEERKLGEGGFGAVYRGYLPNLDLVVAVKRISKGSKQGKREYVTKVKTISQLRHQTLVQLISWCHDKSEFLLIYEFMPNGSLDSHLFGKRAPLSWLVRHKISLGLAFALLYLHEEWEQCVVHRDIKPSNVMLDASFNVKLGDFGLARLKDHDLGPRTTGLVGTLGYLAPEYISIGKISKESDLFSFGVVLLEIATGKKSVDLSEKTEM